MKRTIWTFMLTVTVIFHVFSQNHPVTKPNLSIEKIMLGEKWVGVSPSQLFWAEDNSSLYFKWNPENRDLSELYSISPGNTQPRKVTKLLGKNLPSRMGVYNKARTLKVYTKNGDLFLLNILSEKIKQITRTNSRESNPEFNLSEDKIIYTIGNNIFSWEIKTGQTRQLTQLKSGQKPPKTKSKSDQEKWLYNQQVNMFEVLKERKNKREEMDEHYKDLQPVTPKDIYIGKANVRNLQLSPNEKYITYILYYPAKNSKPTQIPKFVTESGYTEVSRSRPKVGTPYFDHTELYIYDIQNDTIREVATEQIPGITDQPDYLKDYINKEKKKPKPRKVTINGPIWSDNGEQAVVDILSLDFKDRWIMSLDLENGNLKLLDHQHDDAWIGGPGIGWWGSTLGWIPNTNKVYFQSEETGYSHLYTIDSKNLKKKALTSGHFEIYNPFISKDKSFWYFSANPKNPGIRNFYKMAIKGGKLIPLTKRTGRNDVTLSPDEKWMAILNSSSNRPWELYLKPTESKDTSQRITYSQTADFSSYPWRIPQFITFKASDGISVPARLYRPDQPESQGPAIIFVHGAGYLQNAHQWWSSYFHEYMFHNFLVDHGYTVLDIDYRGSAGYGRDWRTAIYRHMGGKDLTDQVDGAKYLTEKLDVSPDKIGIYGGSYGGFMTLMALFTKPDVFACGAALRSVTDWAHYNHGYTAEILNTPVMDSLAYVRSSPIYFANGLTKPLLMCHGMIDDNVHFEDIVRLTQRLIELGKENWELAVYPLERHGFVEASSWTDEYRRIYKLFEENLK